MHNKLTLSENKCGLRVYKALLLKITLGLNQIKFCLCCIIITYKFDAGIIAQLKLTTIYLFLYQNMKKTNPIDCFQCKYFYVTWEPANPRGCKAFGFKTARIPSDVVLETSGEDCLKFTPKKNPTPKNSSGKGWIA